MSQRSLRRNMRRHTAPSSRKRLWLGLGALATVLLALWVIVPVVSRLARSTSFKPEVTGAPRVAVDQEAVDFGDVRLGRTVEAVFKVSNAGDQALTVLGEPRVELIEGC